MHVQPSTRNSTCFNGFFDSKRVLVTGALGVKGTWMCLKLLAAGATVTGVDVRIPARQSNFELSGLSRRIRVEQEDVTNFPKLQRLMQEHDCVFHLAALVLVHDCEARPLETYRTNTLGTASVLEAFRTSARTKYGIFVTTDKVYREKHHQLWVEGDPLFATGSYAISKACAEQIIADYRTRLDVEGKRFGIGRAGNVIIGGDFYTSSRTKGAGRIVPDCFEALMAGKAPTIFCPSFTRPYTYGLDIIAGYMSLMARLDEEGVHGEPFNFGPQQSGGIPNGLLATEICEEWGEGIQPEIGKLRAEPFATQALNWEKAHQRLGWRPAYNLTQGIQDTVEWYRSWSKLQDSESEGDLNGFNAALIQRHQGAAAAAGAWWAQEYCPPGEIDSRGSGETGASTFGSSIKENGVRRTSAVAQKPDGRGPLSGPQERRS